MDEERIRGMDNRLPDSGVRDYDSTGSEVEGIFELSKLEIRQSRS